MIYVRTKDKIYQIDKRIALCNVPPWLQTGDEDKFYPANKPEEGVFESEILKEADTIEELCDEWIIIPKDVNCNPYIRHIFQDISHFINPDHIVFAAIWCRGSNNEPILKPVAKMSWEGESILL